MSKKWSHSQVFSGQALTNRLLPLSGGEFLVDG
jgi:hypothetical protein